MRSVTTKERQGQTVIAVSGMPKTGKTWLALATSPRSVYYHELDTGELSRVLPALPDDLLNGNLFAQEYGLASEGGDQLGISKVEADRTWLRFKREYKKSIIAAAAAGGTVVVDTGSLLWELAQAALVDANSRRGAMEFGLANREYRGMIGFAREAAHRCNLVLIHHVREVWEKDDRDQWQATGRYNPKMHKETEALVDAGLWAMRPFRGGGKTDFRLRFDFCGLDHTMEGTVLDPSGDTAGSLALPATLETVFDLLSIPRGGNDA